MGEAQSIRDRDCRDARKIHGGTRAQIADPERRAADVTLFGGRPQRLLLLVYGYDPMDGQLTMKASAEYPSADRITLIASRLMDKRPEFDDIRALERACLECSKWQTKPGALLFHPVKISSRFYTLLHTVLRPLLSHIRRSEVFVSIGLAYRHYLLGKTFPYFTFGSKLRVLWVWDAWEPRLKEIAELACDAKIDVLLVSSLQASEHIASILPQRCEVHWVPETIDLTEYRAKPWNEKKIDVLAFGRSLPRYNEAIKGLSAKGLNCVIDQRFATREEFISALADAKISICFPKAVTDPTATGRISTVTHRYLQSMAAKCLIVGETPAEAHPMFGYDPVVSVDWRNPADQLLQILDHPESYTDLIEQNFAKLSSHHQVRHFVARIEKHIHEKLNRSL